MHKTTIFSVKISKKGEFTLGDPKPPVTGKWILIGCFDGPTVDQWTKNFVAVWEQEDEE